MVVSTAVNPLQLLQQPSSTALQQLQQNFENYSNNLTDQVALQGVIAGAAQMHGVFTMLDDHQAASLMREVKTLMQQIAAGVCDDPQAVREIVTEVILTAPRYFEWLSQAGEKNYFDLLPLIESLRTLRAVGWGNKAGNVVANDSGKTETTFEQLIIQVRPRLQRALVQILGGQQHAFQNLAQGFEQLRRGAACEEHHRLCWLAESLALEAHAGTLTNDQALKPLLLGLDKCVRRLRDGKAGGGTVASLSKRLEKTLAASAQGAQRIAAPPAFQPFSSRLKVVAATAVLPLDQKALYTVVDLVREALNRHQEIIDQFERNPDHGELLRNEPKRLRELANTLILIRLDVPAKILQMLAPALEQWLARSESITSERILALAGDVVLVQGCLESYSDPIHGYKLASRDDVRDERDAITLVKKIELKRARQRIAQEGSDFIDQIWLFTTDFIDSEVLPNWNRAIPVLRLASGVFTMLECIRAAAIVDRLMEVMRELIQGATLVDHQRFIGGCAHVIVSLESYLGVLANYDEPNDTLLNHTETCLAELTTLVERALPSTMAVRQSDSGVLTATSEHEGHVVMDQELNHSDSTLDDGVALVAEQRDGQAVAEAATLAAEVDDEILEVFLEEVQGEIANIQKLLPVWRADLAEHDSLTAIRRAFHTLKGSGRMVGEAVLGEFAWSFEQLLNHLLDGRGFPNAAIIDVVEAAANALREDIGTNRSGLGEGAYMTALAAHADALREGRPSALPQITEKPIVSVEPVVETTVQPVVETAPIKPAQAELEPEPELIQALLEEGDEILDSSDSILQQWREEPENISLINDLRRAMHTLKGGARMAGFRVMGDLAHAMESILEAVSKRELASAAVPDVLQRTLDELNAILFKIRQGQPLVAATDLLADLERLLSGEMSAAESARQAAEQARRDEFLAEAKDLVESGDLSLRRWSQDTASHELLADLQRDLGALQDHARSGSYAAMMELSDVLGRLLQAIDRNQVEPDREIVDVVERALDGLNQMLARIRDNIALQRPEHLLTEINGLLSAETVAGAVRPVRAPTITTTPRAQAKAERKSLAATAGNSIRVDAELLGNLANQISESSIYRSRVEQGVSGFTFNTNELGQTISRLRQQLRRLEIETEAQILFRREDSKEYSKDFDPLELDRFSELQQLSRSLLEIVDDLTNVQNSLEDQTQAVGQLLYQQGQINKEVQGNMMKTRMVRFSSVLPRLRRVVRQVSQELGKQVELVVHGDDTDLDRTLLENMVAPLEHMLRNAVYHGIETPVRRQAAGKPAVGTIVLELRREGAEQVLELRDDGAGLNYQAIRAKGEANGLLQSGQDVNEQELITLLLQPGFSTATKVSQISGRGVGLDVLNEAIAAMRGALQIQSETGRGTVFTVRLPFSLEVTQALLVQAGEDTFAVPLLSIEAVNRLAENELATYLAGEKVQHNYGNYDYPLHSIGVLFGSEPPPLDEIADHRPPALLFRSGEAAAALQVDAILGTEEVIIKPVAPQLDEVPGVSGATVLADGRVVIVLDVAALVRNLIRLTQAATYVPRIQAKEPERLLALVIDDSITMRKITTRLLERYGVRVKSAKDGVEAVTMLEDHQPSLVILDIEMPRMDGFEVLAHMRNQAHLRDIPVIMVTSRSGVKHRDRGERLGVDDYLIKPYQDEELLSSLRKVLKARGSKLTV